MEDAPWVTLHRAALPSARRRGGIRTGGCSGNRTGAALRETRSALGRHPVPSVDRRRTRSERCHAQ